MDLIFDSKIEKYFIDYNILKCKIGLDLAKGVKKRLDQLRAAPNFNIYLDIRLGKPHPLSGDLLNNYGINISANFRLIVEPLKKCDSVIVKGVQDYHGQKYNWLIP